LKTGAVSQLADTAPIALGSAEKGFIGKVQGKSRPCCQYQQEYNVLLNPLHPGFLKVRLQLIEPFGYDARLLK
jgi:hypothetical protein